MTEVQAKTVRDSLTVQVQVVQSMHINSRQRLFGGQLMAWMDVVAGVTAGRHCRRSVTTATVDDLQFLAPAYMSDILIITGRLTYVGRSSMEVRIDVEVEQGDNKRTPLNKAYFMMVALDDNEQPVPVPRLILETEEERQEWAAGEKRRDLRRDRRASNY